MRARIVLKTWIVQVLGVGGLPPESTRTERYTTNKLSTVSQIALTAFIMLK